MNELQGENRQPSIYTLKMFTNMEDKIDEIKKTLNDLRVDIAGLPEKMFEKGDARYASKLSEKVVYGMVGVVLTTILIAILYLVIK